MTGPKQAEAVAYWNRASGVVWVEFDDGTETETLAEGVADELSAYDALARGGFFRQKNWLIVPGVPQRRYVDVTRAAAV